MPDTQTERIDEEPARIDLIVFKPPGRPLNTYGRHIITPAWSRRYEKYTPNSEGSHTAWKSFQHYKRWSGVIPQMCELLVGSYEQLGTGSTTAVAVCTAPYTLYQSSVYGEAGKLDKNLPLFITVPSIDDRFIPAPTSLSELQQASLDTMLPLIKSELSIINSVLELRDFKSLPETLDRIASLGFKTHHTLRSYLHASADGWLQTKFNLQPLLSDISGICAALTRTEKRLNDLITREGCTRTMHFQRSLTESTDPSPPDAVTAYPGGQYSQWLDTGFISGTGVEYERFVSTQPAQFHAQMQYNYNYTAYQREHARLLAYLDAFGVNLNPAIIWNAIPWSFVVDWVIGVSRWLSRQTIGNMEPQINIHRYLWSIKRGRSILVTRRSRVVRVMGTNEPSTYSDMVPLPAVTETAYRREVLMPTMSSIKLSGLTETEVSLGAALVIARKASRRRKLSCSMANRVLNTDLDILWSLLRKRSQR